MTKYTHPAPDVDYVSGSSRVYAIIGHPIAQVRSPEMVTAEMVRRGHNAILVPLHVLPGDFDTVVPALMRMPNLDGLIFTIPFKSRALALATEIGANARTAGAINALARTPAGHWKGDVFDGTGCVEGFRRRGVAFSGKRVMIIGAGGAGTAIAIAVAHEHPTAMRLYDLDPKRVDDVCAKIHSVDPAIEVTSGTPQHDGFDILINATPTGMLGDTHMPIEATTFPSSLVVFDAVVMPETTPLLSLAERCGCTTIRGREMMHGQISRIVDYFGIPDPSRA